MKKDDEFFEYFMRNYKPKGYYGEIGDEISNKCIMETDLFNFRIDRGMKKKEVREYIFPIIPAIEVLTMSTDEIYEKYLPIEGEKNPPEGRMSAFDIFDPNVTLMELLNREDK